MSWLTRSGLHGCLAVCVLAAPGVAWAHAALTGSAPSADSVVKGSPGVVELTFSEPVESKFSHISVKGPDGKQVDRRDVHEVGDARHLAVSLQTLIPGSYKVNWSVTAQDTHRSGGSFGFSVAQ